MSAKDKVLLEFIKDIEVAGGISVDSQGIDHPVGDPNWTDLAATYRKACAAMNKQPLVVLEDEEDDDEDADDDE